MYYIALYCNKYCTFLSYDTNGYVETQLPAVDFQSWLVLLGSYHCHVCTSLLCLLRCVGWNGFCVCKLVCALNMKCCCMCLAMYVLLKCKLSLNCEVNSDFEGNLFDRLNESQLEENVSEVYVHRSYQSL